MIRTVKDLIDSHYILVMQIKAELKTNVSKEKFSYLWWFLDPIIMMFIYYFVIGVVLGRGGPGYHTFILSALIGWQWFAKSLNSATGAFERSSGIIKHTPIPLFILIFSPAIANMVYAIFGFIVVLAVVAKLPDITLLALPYLILVQLVFTVAVGCFSSVINMFLPDTKRIVTFIIRIWWFLSPILYDSDRVLSSKHVPEIGKQLFMMNPFATLIPAYRDILVYHKMPDIMGVTIIMIVSLSLLQLGVMLLRKYAYEIPKML